MVFSDEIIKLFDRVSFSETLSAIQIFCGERADCGVFGVAA